MAAEAGGIAVLTAHLADATGYGRIVRGGADDAVLRIVEHKDAGPAELDIHEINTGIMVVQGALLHRWIPALGNDNAQGEYYLTDCIAMAVAEGRNVGSATLADADEALGVNNRRQLAEVERLYQARMAGRLLDAGVTLVDPARLDIRGEVSCGRDVVIDVNVVLQGRVS
ncbi:MAG: bifunctional UDP-N-acetylglucosamine diphosphorylase/glucosamine-1-phosphate N-acetyltransferase GlmU, partial [Rhodocyclaceae bacterium]|nr:bifunctional UDP-N-acetylglucosamine diphosphorylase/glucosamine-1-phosphate N-acetyltransferase GlmU [Rhodocyclaceae bacterium]